MTNQNNEEVLELAKPYQWTGFNHQHVEGWTINTKDDLIAFASALREKDAKLIAMLVDALQLQNAGKCTCNVGNNCPACNRQRLINEALTAAQPTAESFMAEHDARAKADGAIAALKEAEDRAMRMVEVDGNPVLSASELRNMRIAAEKRKSAK